MERNAGNSINNHNRKIVDLATLTFRGSMAFDSPPSYS